MDDLELAWLALLVTNVAYCCILTERIRSSRKRKRSCWAQQWLLDRDNPAKKSMLDLYSDWYQVCGFVTIGKMLNPRRKNKKNKKNQKNSSLQKLF